MVKSLRDLTWAHINPNYLSSGRKTLQEKTLSISLWIMRTNTALSNTIISIQLQDLTSAIIRPKLSGNTLITTYMLFKYTSLFHKIKKLLFAQVTEMKDSIFMMLTLMNYIWESNSEPMMIFIKLPILDIVTSWYQLMERVTSDYLTWETLRHSNQKILHTSKLSS